MGDGSSGQDVNRFCLCKQINLPKLKLIAVYLVRLKGTTCRSIIMFFAPGINMLVTFFFLRRHYTLMPLVCIISHDAALLTSHETLQFWFTVAMQQLYSGNQKQVQNATLCHRLCHWSTSFWSHVLCVTVCQPIVRAMCAQSMGISVNLSSGLHLWCWAGPPTSRGPRYQECKLTHWVHVIQVINKVPLSQVDCDLCRPMTVRL